VGILLHHGELRRNGRIGLPARQTAAAQLLDLRIHLLPLGLFTDQLEGLLGEAVEAQDEPAQRGIEDLVDVVPTVEQRAVGIEHEVAAAGLVRVVEAVPQLVLVPHDEGFAVEGRPDLGVGRVGAEFVDDLVPQVPLHMAADPLELPVAAVDAGQVADRGVLDHDLGRIGVLLQPALNLQQLAAPLLVLEVLLHQGEVGAH
jgi:hypothetical protein